MKKINFTTAILAIYLVVMSVIGWPDKRPDTGYTEYFCVIGISALVILLLRYVQIKRFKIREKNKQSK